VRDMPCPFPAPADRSGGAVAAVDRSPFRGGQPARLDRATGREHQVIGRLAGVLIDKSPPTVVVDVNGIGYEVDVPMSTFYQLPAVSERVALLTHFVVREDAQQLYGFFTSAERGAFRELIRISGVGARTALSVLSGLSVTELAEAVTRQDGARLTRIPGIGKKTAERLLLELKGRLGADLGGAASTTVSDTTADVVHALLALGYNEREATGAVRQLPPGTGVSDGIRLALKSLAKG
jgi:holliday junction DNA helicase RuvA